MACNYINKSFNLRFKHHTIESKTARTILCSHTVATCFLTSTISESFISLSPFFLSAYSPSVCWPPAYLIAASGYCPPLFMPAILSSCLCCLSLLPLPGFVPVSPASLLVFSMAEGTLIMVSLL